MLTLNRLPKGAAGLATDWQALLWETSMELYRCARCRGMFWEDEMAPKRDSQGLRYTYCNECNNARLREYYARNPEKLRAYKAAYGREHPWMRSFDRNEASLAKNARQKVCHAIKSGGLVKGVCEVCGSEDSRAHHDDYSKPLEVRWLCPLHHKALHREVSNVA